MKQVTKIGKVTIRTINYTPTFKGRHNEVKVKCLLVLYNLFLSNRKKKLTTQELADQAGVKALCLYVLLPLWNKWNYINCNSKARPMEWSIASKGRAWLDRHQDAMPLVRYIAEVEQHQAGL